MKAKRSTVFKPIMLSLMVSGLMYGASLPQAVASDLDIYRPAVEGKTTLLLMLDTSGSMGPDWINQDFPGACGTLRTENSGTTPNYVRRFCTQSGQKRYNRLSRLKDAIFQLMDDPTVKDNIVMGVGQYSSQTNSANQWTNADGRSGKVVVPARPLTAAQRLEIKTAVAGFVASGGTPTAHAYAEAGAYLMGTSTRSEGELRTVVYAREDQGWRHYRCLSTNSPQRSGSVFYRYCNSFAGAQSGVPVSGATGFYRSGSFRYYYVTTQEEVTSVGSGFDRSVQSAKQGGQYVSPLPTDTETQECNGQGIYFLTDGEPNNSNEPLNVMRAALQNQSFSVSGNRLADGSQGEHASPETGEFSKWLFDSARNPAGVEIKTAVVGFGAVFAGIETVEKQDPQTGKIRTYYDCRTAPTVDARNACNWGEKTHPELPDVGGFGQGGFYYAASTQEVVDSIKNFVAELKVEIPAVPTGAMVVPQDTLAPDSLQPFAYLPLLEPKPGTFDVVWPGNLKKYRVKDGTIYGADGDLVFNRDGIFAKNTYDFWSKTGTEDKGAIQSGGVFERLPMPMVSNSLTRQVFVENQAGTAITKLEPTKASIDSSIGLVAGLTSTDNLNLKRRYLLNFMGYPLEELNLPVPNLIPRPAQEFKSLGGVVHSTPQILTYSASVDESGALTDERDEMLLFGSLEGALHLVDVKTGVEKMAFIPRQIIDAQPRALRPDVTGTIDGVTPPNPTAFGVDAPWTAYAEYQRKDNKLKADLMYVYGGLRMGGDGFYGINLTSETNPRLLFSIDSGTPGFARLGQTWGQPVVTRIRYNDETRLVVIVSGGYDMDYEKVDAERNRNTAVKGNAVYILDAKTGERLLKVGRTGQGADLSSADLRYSIVGRVNVLDRDADGLTDHLYFADLGGQVFRVDLQNAPKTETSKFGVRVVRLADLTRANGGSKPGPRFYESPVITIHDQGGSRFALVNVASGDRSNPLDDESRVPNRVYGLIDRDVARVDLYSTSVGMNSQNIELGNLIEKPSSVTDTAAMLSTGNDRKEGWYYPLDAYGSIKSGLRGLKAFNEGAAIRNDLYISVYNPNVINNGSNKCSAQVLGASELHRYCLPFGVCPDRERGGDTNRQRFSLGQGIQAVNFGSGEDPNTRRLLFQRKPTGADGLKDEDTGKVDDQHVQYLTPPRLVPLSWYEKQPKLK